jgi:hypothetical protein
MEIGIPSLAGASCLCWVIHLALSNHGVHNTLAFVDADTTAVAHTPREAMELLSALSEDLLAKARATGPGALVQR